MAADCTTGTAALIFSVPPSWDCGNSHLTRSVSALALSSACLDGQLEPLNKSQHLRAEMCGEVIPALESDHGQLVARAELSFGRVTLKGTGQACESVQVSPSLEVLLDEHL